MDETGSIDIEDYGPYAIYAAFLQLDINYSFARCLDALQMFDDVATGRSAREVYPGEVHSAVITKQSVIVQHLFLDDRRVEVPFNIALEALEQFAVLLLSRPLPPGAVRVYRPDLPRLHGELHLWESTWKRPHPYRGRLGIPTQGSE
ncbi:hypothetical protein [Glycomyces sp. YM15]|uniref:hypothetical protein n=1 Tax=Glycomyces sp. YM15 TaxID=2800446 RepID=UPI0019639FD9|nr:hypothetical protein [Glycomyces sp. YM15]